MRRPVLAVLAAVSLASLSGSFVYADPAPPAQAVQPDATPKVAMLERLPSGHVAVSVRANGQGPFRLVLDTGSPITFLSKAAAIKLGLTKPDATPQTGLMAMMRPSVQLQTLSVGEATLKNFTVMVLDHPTIEMLSQVEGPLDGIVGFSFFSRFHTTLDYAAGKATFVPGDYEPQDIMTTLMKRLMGPQAPRRVIAPAGIWGFAVEKGADGDGVTVTQVFAGSAAAAAGLKIGDRILTLDSRWTDSARECYESASLVAPGEAVPVTVLRAGKSLQLTVRPRAGL